MPDSSGNSTAAASDNGNPTGSPSLSGGKTSWRDLAEMGLFQHLLGLTREEAEHQRMVQMAERQLSKHGLSGGAADDMHINWHSPTIHNPPPQPKNGISTIAKAAMLLAAIEGIGVLGVGAYALYKISRPAAVSDTDTDTITVIEGAGQ